MSSSFTLHGGIALLVGACVLSAQAPQTREREGRKPHPRRPFAGAAIERESYSYGRAGHRDPFVSLLGNDEPHPRPRDLKLVAIALDPAGRTSIAILRDLSNGVRYRVTQGDAVGRMRVVAIREKSVAVAIETSGGAVTHSFVFSAQPTMP